MSNPFKRARRAKSRNKAYQPRPIHVPLLVAAGQVFGPLVAILDRLEIDGTVEVDGKGNPIMRDGEGDAYDAAGGIEGLRWHMEMYCTRHSVTLPLDGLRELEIAFRYCAPVQASTIRKLREALPVLQRAMATADPDDQIDLLQQTRIKAEMEASA